ncbi:PAS domain-containing protein [Radicibacter daui]|uniref:PAS domain-containing protein n=1 Tax=Radicibacter daui TaxID=3064829 RepID=UPI004046D6D4
MFIRSGNPSDLDPGALRLAVDKSFACVEFAADGIITGANDNFLRMAGYSLAEIKGRHDSIFVDPREAGSDAYREFWRQLAAGKEQGGEFRRLHKSGGELWLEGAYSPVPGQHGRVARVVKIATDITARKLEVPSGAGRLLAAHSTQAVIEFTADGRVLDANDNFLSIMGYELAEIRGQHHSLFVPEEQGDSAHYRSFWNRLAAGEHQAGLFFRRGRDGKKIWLRAAYNPVLDEQGVVIRVIKFATDVTARQLEVTENTGCAGDVADDAP